MYKCFNREQNYLFDFKYFNINNTFYYEIEKLSFNETINENIINMIKFIIKKKLIQENFLYFKIISKISKNNKHIYYIYLEKHVKCICINKSLGYLQLIVNIQNNHCTLNHYESINNKHKLWTNGC